jgi:alpha-1,2-mannosyltransferase
MIDGGGPMKVGTRVLVVCALVAALGCFIAFLEIRSSRHGGFDLTIYRGAVQWWLHHRTLYSFVRVRTTMGFTYPPFAVLCLLPMAFVSMTTAIVVITTASAVLVLVTTWWLLVPVARRHGWPAWFAVALAVPLVFAMEPIRETLGWGQVNLFLVALVLADVRALQRGGRWAGVGIGLATAIKLTPGLFVAYLALAGHRRAAATAAGTFGVAALLAFVLDPASSVRYWTDALWQTSRVGKLDSTSNQSLLGALARLADPEPPDRLVWVAVAGVVLVLGMRRAVRASRQGDELTGITVTGLLTCLISPVSWTHHLYWVIPAAVVLVDVAGGTPLHVRAPGWLRSRPQGTAAGAGLAAAGVVAAFVVSLLWFFQHGHGGHLSGGFLGVLGEDSYLLIMLALVALLPARAAVLTGEARAAARSRAPARPGGSSPR